MTRLIFVSLLALVSCTAAPLAVATATPRATPTPTLFVTTSAPTASPTPAAAAFRYVAIGASDTVGVGASDPRSGSWPARVAARLPAGTEYLNLGVSGSLASQAVREQLPAAIAAGPQLVTIWLAVNDLNASITASDYATALRSVVAPLVSGTSARIFVGDVPDLRSVPAYAGTDQTALLARIAAYNGAIAAVAATFPERVTVVDLFSGSGPLVSTITVSADGFHPSDAGYALIADRFAAAIAGAGIVLR
ncbi:MAG TPA: GDSL-type esterase/lipase family protein [Patescibacteria group bacterium]|jgi:lysophospholipase L1-like esterase|nr:GDSL-type esterase/lipase family protein [Patescibacteria group bacterium]